MNKKWVMYSFYGQQASLFANDGVKSHTENRYGMILKALLKNIYADYHEDDRMKMIIESLKTIARG